MRIWMWPISNPTNIYNQLLANSVENKEFEVLDFPKLKYDNVKKVRRGDILHFHWLHGTYQHNRYLFFLIKTFKMFLYFFYLKLIGAKLVWTIHNLYPHKYKFKKTEKIVRKLITQLSDKIIVASNTIKKEVIKEYDVKESKIAIILHGHYIGMYPNQNIDFKQKYSIPENHTVFLFFGVIKKYKGVDNLIEIFSGLNIESSTLVIAGNPSEEMQDTMKHFQSKNIKNIRYDLRFIPDGELVSIINIADCVVLPFKEITTSGSAILAASQKKYLIAPKTPFMEEYFGDNYGILYDNESELSKTLIQFSQEKITDNDNINYELLKQKLSWTKIGESLRKLYLEIKH